ncbi:cold-shock protein [Arthrobacter sp. NyZ413]|uniref:cold-shock protein n=1 Tax=Arthrobacter sp. NyZ413 TaxID=3144669 RepID=UPI002CC8093D|nr:cold-shock protein [Arthrobacter sp.]
MSTGRVKWFDPEKGYGFITQDDNGPDVFIHSSALAGRGYLSLDGDQRVSFDILQPGKGLHADNVQPL